LRRAPTLAEKRLWAELRKLRERGFHFRRQAPIGRYIPDFVCHSAKLIVELDGGVHRFTEEQDAARDAWLVGRGFHVLRFDNGAVIQDLTGVLQSIDRHLHKKP
jgi:very-short-patch-repair endonuclease